MDYFNTWNEVITASFQNLWIKFIALIPKLIGVLLVLVIGLFIASALGKLAKKLVNYTQIDKLIEKVGLANKLEKVGLKFTLSSIIGWIVEWFFIIVVLIAVVDILQWTQVTAFLQKVALYVPNVIVAIIILIIGLVVGQLIYEVVERAIKASRLPTSQAGTLAAIAKWAIIIFAVMASLIQLGIATHLIEILFTGLVIGLALAFGLAFGLGGKEKAKEWLEKLGKEISKKE